MSWEDIVAREKKDQKAIGKRSKEGGVLRRKAGDTHSRGKERASVDDIGGFCTVFCLGG